MTVSSANIHNFDLVLSDMSFVLIKNSIGPRTKHCWRVIIFKNNRFDRRGMSLSNLSWNLCNFSRSSLQKAFEKSSKSRSVWLPAYLEFFLILSMILTSCVLQENLRLKPCCKSYSMLYWAMRESTFVMRIYTLACCSRC